MPNWKRVKIDFKTVKLGDFSVPVKTTVAQIELYLPDKELLRKELRLLMANKDE